MRRDITDPMCQRECSDCPFEGVTPEDCPGDCSNCPYSGFCPCGNRFIYSQLAQTIHGMAKPAGAREISVSAISAVTPQAPIVEYDKAMVGVLGRIMELVGQPRPLVVAPKKGTPQTYRLVGGFDIFLAARTLGWRSVLARVVESDKYDTFVEFYRYELLRLDLSWENQARCLLALQDLFRERNNLPPALSTLSELSGLSTSRTRDLLHGITLVKKHGLSDGTIPYPTLLRSVRLTYPDVIQRELVRGLVKEGWTRRRATSHATSKIRRKTIHMVVEDSNQDGKDRLVKSSEQPVQAGGIGNPARNRAKMVALAARGR